MSGHTFTVMDFPPVESHRDSYTISTDPDRLDIGAIHAYLTRSYWSTGIPRETVARAVRNSLCFGLYDDSIGAQIGFSRVITDGATFAYLCDVFVLETHRGVGLGKWMMEVVLEHPSLQGLRRFLLATRDAHSMYEQFGFTPVARPQNFLNIHRPNIYERPAS
ncbi:MAG: GNAT family N-acetyltransferase [Phycisphaerales bacterium]|nr:GNAT family N-acetyltransferase [Phycisphaerales bacterium]